MNKQQLEQHWEACRDGSIGDADRIAFEAYLHAHPNAAAMWKAESQWLQMLADVDGAFEEQAAASANGKSVSGEAFVAGVLEQWQAAQEQEQLGVVATIGPGGAMPALASLTDASSDASSHSSRRPVRYLAMFTGLAAAIALLTLAAIYGNFLGGSDAGTPPGDIAVVVPDVTPPVTGPTQPDTQPDAQPSDAPDAPDALGLLFASAKNNYALAAASPSRIKQGFANTAAFLDVGNLASLLDPGLPDPADFVEQ